MKIFRTEMMNGASYGEYMSGGYNYTVMYYDVEAETKEKASLDDVRDTILDTLSNTYVSSHSEASIKAMQELRKKYNLNITDSELKTSYTNYIQNSLLQAQESDSSSSK